MDTVSSAKLALRDQILAARRGMKPAELAEEARRIAAVAMGSSQVRNAATVAAYVSVGREPGTGALLEELVASGRRVILPLLQADNDLDWAVYDSPDSLLSAARGLLEPTAPPLGLDAIATADLVLVPGLAADRTGMRLGRGGGSYDRAVRRATGTVLVVLNSDEIVEAVPFDGHDQRVHGALTPDGIVMFAR